MQLSAGTEGLVSFERFQLNFRKVSSEVSKGFNIPFERFHSETFRMLSSFKYFGDFESSAKGIDLSKGFERFQL